MAGTWQALANQPTFEMSTMILLSDGRVMVQEEGTKHWHALTPDENGSYVNGTWTVLADMSFWRRYYASGILKDGRVIICGGEQSGDVGDTNKGEIYDPVADSWTSIKTPSWTQVGDAASCILPDGRLLIGALTTTACIIYDPTTDSWTTAGSKAVRSNEESWVLQPDNTIVTTQCWSPYQTEKYIIANDTWQNEGSLPVTLCDTVMHEIGAGVLMYNGHTIFFGAAKSGNVGKTAIYTPPATATGTGTWAAGPDIPQVSNQAVVANDCPATLLPNGKVLTTAAPWQNNNWGGPVYFFEYDPTANTITQAPTPSNNGTFPAGQSSQLYWSRMMLLPTGQVMFSPSSKNVQVYTPDGGPQEGWRPTISSVTAHGTLFFNDYFVLRGTQLNGLSQANMYGDDCSSATNYPLVRLRNTTTNKIYYGRTYDFSTLGVATGPSMQSATFSLSGIPDGDYELCVIANGISSHCQFLSWRRSNKPHILDGGLKRVLEVFGKEVAEGDPWDRFKWLIDPEVNELRRQLKYLQNSVRRLESLIPARELPRAGKEVAREAEAEDRAKNE